MNRINLLSGLQTPNGSQHVPSLQQFKSEDESKDAVLGLQTVPGRFQHDRYAETTLLG